MARLGGPFFISEDHSHIAHTASHAFAVEPLQQRDRVFAADAGQVFESRYVELVGAALLFGKRSLQSAERVAMEYQIVRELNQCPFAQQKSDDLLSPRLVYLDARENIFQCG